MRSLFLVILCLVTVTAYAAVVYTQPPDATGTVLKSAWYPPDGLDGDAYVFDAFTLNANQAITEIHWRGGYTNFKSGAGESPVADFRISIYPSIAAGSQPDVTAKPLVQYPVGGNAGEAPAGTFGGTPLYDYAFVLPTPFQAVAGTKYWLQIEASQGLTPTYSWPPDWGLAAATGGDGSYFRAITGGTNGGGTLYQSISGDAAFSLLTAAPTTYTITTSAMPANGGTTSGGGTVTAGASVMVTATPGTGYTFVNWTENGTVVSTTAGYTFTAAANRTLVANFAQLLIGDLNQDGLVNEDDADLVLQYLLGERPDLDAAIKNLATQQGLPANPPDLRMAQWILGHLSMRKVVRGLPPR